MQLNVKNVFLHEDLGEELYMQSPQCIPNGKGYVCMLRKSFVSLKLIALCLASKSI